MFFVILVSSLHTANAQYAVCTYGEGCVSSLAELKLPLLSIKNRPVNLEWAEAGEYDCHYKIHEEKKKEN